MEKSGIILISFIAGLILRPWIDVTIKILNNAWINYKQAKK